MILRLWPLVAAAISLGIDAYVLAGVLPQVADSLAVSVAAIGLGVTAFTGAYAFAGPLLSGPLVAGSTKRALIVSLGLFNLGNLITALAPEIMVFLGSRVLAGVGAGILTAVATATAAAMVAEHERGRAMALVTFGLSTGTVAGVPLGMLIGQWAGWRWTMGLVVAIGIISMAAVLARRGPYPTILVAKVGENLRLLTAPVITAGVILAFLLGVASLGLYTYLVPMADDRGLASMAFTLVWVWGIGGVAGSALIGRPVDALGSRRLFPVVVVALTVALGALAFLDHVLVWIVAVALWGAAGWASVPVLQHLLVQGRQQQAMAIIAFQMAAMYLGSAAGAALGGLLLDHGTAAGALPGWALGVAFATLVLALIVARVQAVRPSARIEPDRSRS
ncbi:Predicted arabinose efflux permease, MFS family [Marinactinospora thermotolerans DSM 45154]|uniref:Predicted arabinose efflux permease, MFS family n=1 Tax=Marinactinospora thermotolerans DSM 45154 TaxID=1122192 RepID=A0A1T4STA2_9ACTN|nr:MFS transporter [Marinactinospora thermotolerans]SKA31413.1 Predicted arabinose efflux permease, MFS family [Marinactinospora thermotolerans DSM 45154]